MLIALTGGARRRGHSHESIRERDARACSSTPSRKASSGVDGVEATIPGAQSLIRLALVGAASESIRLPEPFEARTCLKRSCVKWWPLSVSFERYLKHTTRAEPAGAKTQA